MPLAPNLRWILPLLLAAPVARGQDRADLLFADFEAATHAPWEAKGEAFGPGPAAGTLPGQMEVRGFLGQRLASSFHGGDGTTGTLTSPPFPIDRKYVAFRIGGGGFEGATCLNLLVDGKVVRTTVGPNTQPGGSEALETAAWDVADLAGKAARLEAVDHATGGWGHISVDHVVFTDHRPEGLRVRATRTLVARDRYLLLPVSNSAPTRVARVLVDGRPEKSFDIQLADGQPEWWAPLEIGVWKGKSVAVEVDRVPETWKALEAVTQADAIPGEDHLYREALRPQLHVSARRGWVNDPNGMVFADGEYHLFFQHNPLGWNWGNMHWGHAVSRDLLHWQELGDALAPDRFGPMFSGSGVVDRKDTSGLGKGGRPPLLFFYTAAGDPTVQGLASSTDLGRTLVKYETNPILGQITPGNRDPKVFWHEPTRRWVMVLYIERPNEPKAEARQAIQFLTSPDAKAWTRESITDGFFECPDLFELPVDGDPARTKWVLTAASSEYMLGRFDGKRFTPESPKLPGHRGKGFYAAQTFADIPAADGRRIQIGWLQAPSPGMAFNQCQSLPLSLSLRTTTDGLRLAREPVKELEKLRLRSHHAGPLTVRPGQTNPMDAVKGELLELRAEFAPGPDSLVHFDVRGVPITYDAAKGELDVHGVRAPAPPREGKIRLTLYADRTAFEVFVNDGLTYVPIPVIPDPQRLDLAVRCGRGEARFGVLDAHVLGSIWDGSR